MADIIFAEGYKDLTGVFKSPAGIKGKDKKKLDCGHSGSAWLLLQGKRFCKECATNGKCNRFV